LAERKRNPPDGPGPRSKHQHQGLVEISPSGLVEVDHIRSIIDQTPVWDSLVFRPNELVDFRPNVWLIFDRTFGRFVWSKSNLTISYSVLIYRPPPLDLGVQDPIVILSPSVCELERKFRAKGSGEREQGQGTVVIGCIGRLPTRSERMRVIFLGQLICWMTVSVGSLYKTPRT
jgi:hypothetical protein